MNPTDRYAPPVQLTLSLLSTYAGRVLSDSEALRASPLTNIGVSSLALASVIVELEERLDRPLDFEAFAGVHTVADLLRALGLT